MTTDFVHLHVHTHFSLLDAMNRIEELVTETRRRGMRAIAMTDHGNLFGAIEFYQAAYRAGVKPIIGCEVYVAPGHRSERIVRPDGFERGFHLTLLAATAEGYRNLVKLSSLAFTEGFYYHPRVDHESLAAHAEGLIALSGCLSGEVARLYLGQREPEAIAALRRYRDIFGKGNFFVELQDHGIEAQRRLTQFLLERSRADAMPTVATNDVHYIRPEDARIHDALLCIGTRSLIKETHRKRYDSDQFFLKTPDEMKRRFAFEPDAVTRTLEIAERVELDLVFGKHHLPAFPLPVGAGSEPEHLEKLAREGLKRQLGDLPEIYLERLKNELAVINRKGFAGYFLIVADFINEAKRRGIPVGPGRGSAAGSLVAFALGITEIDPIPYNLFFERFLNPERTSLPDIDVDICQERRDEVISYVRQRYGEDRVAQIITFGTFGAKAMIRDAGRILDIAIPEVENLVKLVPDQLRISLAESVEKVPELATAAKEDYAELFEIALRLEGLARHASRHAAGVVISNVPITEVVPLYRDADGNIVTQYDMNSVQDMGLLKIDILGLKTLTVIHHAAAACEPILAWDAIGTAAMDDPEVYRLLASGRTLGVFQLDSSGIRDLLARIKPSCFEDLAALIALYRPGPMSLSDEFAARKHGRSKVQYLIPQLEPILKETYGIILYQEQVMAIAAQVGGFTLAEADKLRQAMGKKKAELMQESREKFIAGAIKRGVGERTAGELFAQMEAFAGYGFNKSHAVAYAVIAYKTAWLKVYHGAEFMAAQLSHELGDRDKIGLYIAECRRMGLAILPPHVNHSGAGFAPERSDNGAAIRCGLAAIKNAGVAAGDAIMEERRNGPYRSLWDFLGRVDQRKANRRALEVLIACGAFDGLGPNRRSMREALEMMWNRATSDRRRSESDQISLFGDEPSAEPSIPRLDEFEDLAALEMEHLGFYIGEHPLERAFPAVRFVAPPPIAEGHAGWILALLRNLQTMQDKRGRTMARAKLETLESNYEAVVFASALEKSRGAAVPAAAVVVLGRFESGDKILVDQILPVEKTPWTARLVITAEGGEARLRELEALLEELPKGRVRTEILFQKDGKKYLLRPKILLALTALLDERLSSIANIRLSPAISKPSSGEI